MMVMKEWGQLDRQLVVEKDECTVSTGRASRAALSQEFPIP